MDEQNEIVKDFLIESFEYLDTLDEDLLTIENESKDPEILARIFRAVHTIKGTGGFLGFNKLVSIAHAGEELLDNMRRGRMESTPDVISILFDLVDALREVLTCIEATGQDGEDSHQELVEALKNLRESKSGYEHDASGPEPPSRDRQEKMIRVPRPAHNNQPAAPPEQDVDGLEDIVQEFVRQSYDAVKLMRREVNSMQSHVVDHERMSIILEQMEIVRFSAGFLSFGMLVSLLQAFRDLVDRIKVQAIVPTEEVLQVMREFIAAVGQILDHIDKHGIEGAFDYADLKQRASALYDKNSDQNDAPALFSEGSDDQSGVEKNAVDEGDPSEAASQDEGDANHIDIQGESNRAEGNAPTKQVGHQTPSGKASSSKDQGYKEQARSSLTDNNIRVDVDLLDTLMNLVGELVLTRNQILQFTSNEANLALAKSSQNLNLITTELQEGVMKTRMQTIGTIWRKFPRVVRDLAKSCDKQARVEMEGEDTELDKTIIEAIKDPLTHLIRNSVDHGIEAPENRIRAGKPREGRILLHAFHEGGNVNIEISDDGSGIDPDRIKQKALENGVVTQSEIARMSDREVLNLIFMPGLSTAKEVSNISGRGVGMDVVKTHIERIGGSVDINSWIGEGTTIKIKIPLTLAIIPALMVKVDEHRFAIPQVNLLELVRLEREHIEQEIEMIHGTPVYRLRGKLLPLVYLDKELELNVPSSAGGLNDDPALNAINIVVLQAEDQIFGLVVREVIDTEEVVVKPLSKLLKQIPVLAGATIMGDGKVALILDVVGLARKGGVMAREDHNRTRAEGTAFRSTRELTTLLVARVSGERQVAIELSKISRLEEIDEKDIERVGNQEVVQYRDYLMPLVWLSMVLGSGRTSMKDEQEYLQVVVCNKNGLNVGLVVNDIVDVVDERVPLSEPTDCVTGVAVIQNRVTEILNIQEVLESIDTRLLERGEDTVSIPVSA